MQELQTLSTAGQDNSLENIFLSLTGSSDVKAIVEELTT